MVSNGSEDGQRAKISTVATHTKPVQVTAYCGELLSTVAQLIVILSEESLEFLSCTFLTTEMPDDFRAVRFSFLQDKVPLLSLDRRYWQSKAWISLLTHCLYRELNVVRHTLSCAF